MKKFIFRRRLIKNGFFDGIICNCKETENSILDWMFNLYKDKNILINHFSYLFIKYEIIFPIKISKLSCESLEITDYNGNQCILRHPYNEIYFIEKRNYPFGKFFKFKISMSNNIILMQFDVIQLYKNNTGKIENMLSFVYNYEKNFTAVGVKHAYQKEPYLKITYPSQTVEFDNKISILLCNITSSKDSFKDVFDILIDILSIGNFQTLSINSKKDSQILSEIVLEDGIVKVYSYTKKINDSNTCFYRITMSKDINEFIAECLKAIQNPGSP